jgi:hypothetical protein
MLDEAGCMTRWLKRILKVFTVLLLLFGVMQLIPYGRDHSNPPVIREPAWDTPRTRELAVKACFDCHSNQTKWPWYSNVAPYSWVVQRHVVVGREVLNFSDWTKKYLGEGQAAANVLLGDMPLASYRVLHPEARLTKQEKLELARGLQATFGLPWRED